MNYNGPTKGGFPDENVSSLEKQKKEYQLQFAQAVMAQVDGLQDGSLGYRSRELYRQIRRYAMGRQPLAPYYELLAPKQDVDENGLLSLAVSDRIVELIPKLRTIGISLIEKANADYDLVINPIDPQAALELEEEVRDMKAKIVLRQALNQGGMPEIANNPAIARQPGEPDDLQGAEVQIMGMRHKVAMKSELIISQIFNSNKYPELRQSMGADLFDFGVCVGKDSTVGCQVKLRKIDMRGFICSPFTEPDASDVRYAGEIRDMPINQLLVESNGQIEKPDLDELFKIAKAGGGQGRYANLNYDWRNNLQQGRVQVLELEFLSIDIDAREERENSYGNKVFGRTKPTAKESEGKKVYKKYVQNVYACKWVVGTDILYDFGRQVNAKIDPKNEATARLSYHIVTGHCEDMVPYSRTKAMIYHADRAQLLSMKLEHLFNTAVPKGYSIDLSAVEDIAMNAGGQTMSPADVLQLFFTRGVLPYRSQSLVGDNANNKPIQDILGGLGPELAEYQNGIAMHYQAAKEAIGLNEVTDGNAPNPKRLNAGTEAAITGTKNAMSDVFNADRKLMKDFAEGSMIRAQNLFKAGRGEDFINALGTDTVMFIKGLPTIEPYKFGFTIEDRPSPDDLQQFELAMQKALQENQIGIDDMMTIRNMRNLKQQTAYLVYAVRKNRETQQQIATQQAEQNAQLQAQAAEQAESAKQKTLQMEFQLKGALLQQQMDLQLRNDQSSGLTNQEVARIDSAGRTSAAWIQAAGRDAASIREVQAKLAESENPNASTKATELSIPADLEKGITPQSTPEKPFVPGQEEIAQKKFSFLAPPAGGSQQESMPPSDPMSGMPEEPNPMGDESMPEEGETPMDEGMEQQGQPAMADEGPSEEQIMQMLQGA